MMTVRELITKLLDCDMDEVVVLEVGGDGTLHSGWPVQVTGHFGSVLISSEEP